MACARTTNAVVYFICKHEHHGLRYLEEWGAYNDILVLADQPGLDLAPNKCISPTQSLTWWLGFNVSAQDMTLKVPLVRLTDVLTECEQWGKLSDWPEDTNFNAWSVGCNTLQSVSGQPGGSCLGSCWL